MNPILWIHGFPFTSAIFAKQLAIPGVEHVMPDLPARDSVDDFAKFAVEQLDARGIEKATFAGLSMGGYVCLAAMRLFPERVSGLILIDTRATADTEEGRKGRYAMLEQAQREGTEPIVEAMLPKMLTASAPEDMREYVREVMRSAPREFVIGALKAMATRPDSSALLPTITVPTLVIAGEEDPIMPMKDAEAMAAAIPNARLVKIAGAAHIPNVEKADEVNTAVLGVR
ncbi:MAG TPA: alpha/beta fold hydrolase [Thermoanaerobaculia bacterium]|jgi:pimeloyl-ACP methyl ester carboxylesterase